ncbi:MAG: formylglycine-generating enzyme family protein [Geopsychrobacter sp.]|nr:formylglycine-generating enzyme family protein [Geopsychrobacter sp.]
MMNPIHKQIVRLCTLSLMLTMLLSPTLVQAAKRYVEPATGMEFVFIPAGEFSMGDISGKGSKEEQPVHRVAVPGFYMGRYEVTFAQYDTFCAATHKKKPSDDGWGRGDRPVINVSWNEATDFAIWLSEQTGQQFRLPSEAEWEYAARAGTTTEYWWGNTIGKGNAHCADCGKNEFQNKTAPVGRFGPNPWNLFDTAGNVTEYCFDNLHPNYKDAPTDGRSWRGGDTEKKTLRGGSWQNFALQQRAAARDWEFRTTGHQTVGFRLAMDAPTKPTLPALPTKK